MQITFFSAQSYDELYFNRANAAFGHALRFLPAPLNEQTAVLADGSPAVCIFVNDRASAPVVAQLAGQGVRLLALRSAGFNHVDLEAAQKHGISVVRVPAYSPHAVAEHAVALILALNRKTHKAYNRVREGNFSLERLTGFDLYGKTVGVVGTGKIGATFASIMQGFGCRVVAYDPYVNDELTARGVQYVELDELLATSDIISLHSPLTEQTRHLIDARALARMKRGAMLINTGRGALIDTPDVIEALKSGQLGYLGIDVYEQEESLFFRDFSETVIQDDVIQRLLTFPNVLVTAHQAFFTEEALLEIARVTLGNATAFERGETLVNACKI
jgi:D-lactate dehydrogenase